MVFQSYTLFPWLTVEENIGFGLREQGVAGPERRQAVASYVERVGLRGFEHHYPRMLSGGMQQRTALARALANDPKVLLLDEPFGALDNQTRALMQELLLGIWEADRKTVLFVTHDIDEAIFMANRVAVMTARPGRIKSDVRDRPAAPAPLHGEDHARVLGVQGAAHGGDQGGIDPRSQDGRLAGAQRPMRVRPSTRASPRSSPAVRARERRSRGGPRP